MPHSPLPKTSSARRRPTRTKERSRQSKASGNTNEPCAPRSYFHVILRRREAPRRAPIGHIDACTETANAITCSIFQQNAINTDRHHQIYERIFGGDASRGGDPPPLTYNIWSYFWSSTVPGAMELACSSTATLGDNNVGQAVGATVGGRLRRDVATIQRPCWALGQRVQRGPTSIRIFQTHQVRRHLPGRPRRGLSGHRRKTTASHTAHRHADRTTLD